MACLAMPVLSTDVDLVDEPLTRVLEGGGIAILPTDTIYGLSARADDPRAVLRLDALKGRSRPSTLIPHDHRWLAPLIAPRHRAHLEATLRRHRGATLLFPVSATARRVLPPSLTQSGLLGVREPRHWITELVRALGFPLLTTSANRTGEHPMTSLEDLDARIAAKVDLIVYQGPLHGRPSDLIFLDGARARRVRR